LLDIGKLESGRVEVKNSNFELRNILEQVFAEFKPEAHCKELKLALDSAEDFDPNIFALDSIQLAPAWAACLRARSHHRRTAPAPGTHACGRQRGSYCHRSLSG